MAPVRAPLLRTRWVRLLAAMLALLLLASCSTSDGDDAADESSADAPTAPAEGEESGDSAEGGGVAGEAADDDSAGGGDGSSDEGAQGGAGADGGPAPVVLTPADIGRSIVYTAAVVMQADDVAETSRQAQLAVTALGGFVFGQQTTTDPQPRTVLVFKIDPTQFGPALEAIGGVGEVVSQDVTADDVTERVVDLQSQIASLEISVARLRDLLADAPNLEAIASLEAQLLDRETQLEQLRGQLRTLEGQVSLATITLTVSQPAALPSVDVEVTAYVGDDEGERCPGDDELDVDEGDEMVLCLSIENSGNVALTEIEVRDHSLDLDPEDVTLVDFEGDDVLEPGDVVVAWARFTADPDDRPSPDVSAVPLDEAGNQLRVGVEATTTPVELDVEEDRSLPGFGDGFGTAVGVLATAWGVLVLVAGIALPLAIVAAPVVAAVVWWRRRHPRPSPPPDATTW